MCRASLYHMHIGDLSMDTNPGPGNSPLSIPNTGTYFGVSPMTLRDGRTTDRVALTLPDGSFPSSTRRSLNFGMAPIGDNCCGARQSSGTAYYNVDDLGMKFGQLKVSGNDSSVAASEEILLNSQITREQWHAQGENKRNPGQYYYPSPHTLEQPDTYIRNSLFSPLEHLEGRDDTFRIAYSPYPSHHPRQSSVSAEDSDHLSGQMGEKACNMGNSAGSLVCGSRLDRTSSAVVQQHCDFERTESFYRIPDLLRTVKSSPKTSLEFHRQEALSYIRATDRCREANSNHYGAVERPQFEKILPPLYGEEFNQRSLTLLQIPKPEDFGLSDGHGARSEVLPQTPKRSTSLVSKVSFDSLSRAGSGTGSNLSSPSSGQNTNSSLYKTELCRSWEEVGFCRYGPKCQFAHGQDELRPVTRHPKYKTEVCRTFTTNGTCPYGKRCRFIHKTSLSPGGGGMKVPLERAASEDISLLLNLNTEEKPTQGNSNQSSTTNASSSTPTSPRNFT